MSLEHFEPKIILRGTIGSVAHGINLETKEPDRDEIAVCIEDAADAIGVGAPFEQWVHRTAAIREGYHDAPSKPGDLDLTIYSLRKFVRLALKGNPTILSLLFLPNKHIIKADSRGYALVDLVPDIISREAGSSFLGYFRSQRQRMMGERGQMRIHRDDLVCAHGYDTKYAAHILRLGIQGIELLQDGQITIPMRETDRQFILSVRRGEVDMNAMLTRAGQLESDLKDAVDSSTLPDTPNYEKVQKWMVDAYVDTWSARRPPLQWASAEKLLRQSHGCD